MLESNKRKEQKIDKSHTSKQKALISCDHYKKMAAVVRSESLTARTSLSGKR